MPYPARPSQWLPRVHSRISREGRARWRRERGVHMTDGAPTGSAAAPNGGKGGAKAGFKLVVGKATDAFKPWQQIPAWVLGLAAIIGAGFLIAFPRHLTDAQTRDAWAAVIVALFLAVLLSFRSAFTL